MVHKTYHQPTLGRRRAGLQAGARNFCIVSGMVASKKLAGRK